MAFAAHPSEPSLVYVDNYGGSFAQEFTADTFGKAYKVDAAKVAGRTVAFVGGGQMVIVGGAGSLTAYCRPQALAAPGKKLDQFCAALLNGRFR